MKRTARFVAHVERFANRWWYPPAVALLAAADLFVVLIPTDGLLITSVLLQPKHWIRLALWISLGSGLGALALSAAIHIWGEPLVLSVFGNLFETEAWRTASEFLNDYGVIALALTAAGPIPQQAAVVFCALARMPNSTIFLAVLTGRALKYLLLGWIASHAPTLLLRFRGAKQEAEEIKTAAEEEEKASSSFR